MNFGRIRRGRSLFFQECRSTYLMIVRCRTFLQNFICNISKQEIHDFFSSNNTYDTLKKASDITQEILFFTEHKKFTMIKDVFWKIAKLTKITIKIKVLILKYLMQTLYLICRCTFVLYIFLKHWLFLNLIFQ